MLPDPLPWETEVVVIARAPRADREEGSWRATLGGFLAAGGRVAPAAFPALEAVPGLGVASMDPGALAPARVALPHPAAGGERGVAPAIHRLPFPVEPRSLAGRTLAFLAAATAALGAAVVLARRRGWGQLRAGLAAGGVSAAGCALLFLPGVLGSPFREARLVLEERASPDAPAARRVEILRIERLRPGGEDPVVGRGPGASWTEIRYAADGPAAREPDGTVRLDAPGRYAVVAGVSGVETPAPAGTHLVTVVVRGDRAWRFPGGAMPDATHGPGEPFAEALASLRRDGDPRISRAGALLSACFRPPPGSGPYLLAVRGEGPDAEVVHLPR